VEGTPGWVQTACHTITRAPACRSPSSQLAGSNAFGGLHRRLQENTAASRWCDTTGQAPCGRAKAAYWKVNRRRASWFALDMATCPFCRGGSLRIIAAITQESVITRILRHLKLTSVPPPIAPTRLRQETFDWVA